MEVLIEAIMRGKYEQKWRTILCDMVRFLNKTRQFVLFENQQKAASDLVSFSRLNCSNFISHSVLTDRINCKALLFFCRIHLNKIGLYERAEIDPTRLGIIS